MSINEIKIGDTVHCEKPTDYIESCWRGGGGGNKSKMIFEGVVDSINGDIITMTCHGGMSASVRSSYVTNKIGGGR